MGKEQDENAGYLRIQDIPALNQSNCKMRDPERVEKIINEFVSGGPERMQFVSDFDYTITKQRTEDNLPVLSSFGIFNACKSLPTYFKEESDKLFHKYRPIEIDPHMPIEEKVQHMIEWWTQSAKLASGFAFDETEIEHTASKFKRALRDHTHELFATLLRLQIPVLVFSAGLGNSVVSVLQQANIMHPNVKVVSNFLQYRDGVLDGFQQPMIHTFNKNETVLDGSEYYELVHTRDHIIVMGDSLGDADMANGVPASSHIMKIGFLFDHVEANMEKYMNTFDIVLVDDQTMDVPLALLALVEQRHQLRHPHVTNGASAIVLPNAAL
ncbi:7-methylguanosine phosphate-specific 5'-nucleotidase [Drosophila sulfurigaster albostrigata]|uniref:7-methylguanosine phosphate-specific 5'-nucleotidase n=1 Tax=Drosophila sulfurigaster albostrigata TaxID=89887 RepID=UPI002D21EAFD|nr:7-methylguanosine phosphate-specific 5'-nucleotidase [Drosophila sulfurigaster albostrigata]XP_062135583.1 7-methylguanosine phosphate-specific 5'-nucleotidase [Drosophila sulfurigaster albostrigata]